MHLGRITNNLLQITEIHLCVGTTIPKLPITLNEKLVYSNVGLIFKKLALDFYQSVKIIVLFTLRYCFYAILCHIFMA